MIIKVLWVVIYLLGLVWSGIHPKDQLTWLLEVSPAIIAAVLMAATYKRFTLTPMLYFLILCHCLILMVGGHYTYAEVPLFDGLWGAERNNFDKLGHFFQGFVPALAAREILIRNEVLGRGMWLNTFVISVCLAFSAFYELIEWWVAVLIGQDADAFLGTQGYSWDTQSDMALALLGALLALMLLSKTHDKQLAM